MAKVLISIGANTPDKQSILQRTIQAIGEISHIIAQTPIFISAAEGSTIAAPYANALIVAITNDEYDTLRHTFKQWEINAGRTIELKRQGIIPLDIDIIMWNDTIIKERDMQMNYMKHGLQLLDNH